MRRSDLGGARINLHCESIVHFHRRRLYSHHLKGTSLGQLSHEVLWLYILSESERRDLAAKLVQPHPPAKCAPSRICRSEEHTSELQSLMRISYAVFCLKKKQTTHTKTHLH